LNPHIGNAKLENFGLSYAILNEEVVDNEFHAIVDCGDKPVGRKEVAKKHLFRPKHHVLGSPFWGGFSYGELPYPREHIRKIMIFRELSNSWVRNALTVTRRVVKKM